MPQPTVAVPPLADEVTMGALEVVEVLIVVARDSVAKLAVDVAGGATDGGGILGVKAVDEGALAGTESADEASGVKLLSWALVAAT